MKILAFFAILLVLGLLIPASAQSAQRDPDYAQAVNSAKECKKAIDQDTSKSEAEKIVAKKKCARDSASTIYGNFDGQTTRLKELRIKNLVQCETWYDQFKINTVEQFKVLKPSELADNCIFLYNDSIWQYSGKDRLQKLLDRADELGLFSISKIKAKIPEAELAPFKQLDFGIPKTHIDCKDGFILIYKISDKKPACVSIDSVDKLIKRGWGSLRLT